MRPDSRHASGADDCQIAAAVMAWRSRDQDWRGKEGQSAQVRHASIIKSYVYLAGVKVGYEQLDLSREISRDHLKRWRQGKGIILFS